MRSLTAAALVLLAGLGGAAAFAAEPGVTATLDGAPLAVTRLSTLELEAGDLVSGITVMRLPGPDGKPEVTLLAQDPTGPTPGVSQPLGAFFIAEVRLPWQVDPEVRPARPRKDGRIGGAVYRAGGRAVFLVPRALLPCTLAFRRPIEAVTDQAALARIALEDADPAYRLGAVRRVADQPLLCRLAAADRSADIRLAAVERCADQPLLAGLTAPAEPLPIRSAAVARITDQPLLTRLALEDGVPALRLAAAARVSQAALLARLALEASDPAVRRSVLERSTDQPLLARAAVEERDEALRAVALARCGDQGLLSRRAVDEPVVALRRQAVGRLSDQAVLATVALRDADAGVREAAARRLTDREAQDRVVAGSEDPAVLSAVAANLHAPAALMRLATRPAARPLRGTIDRQLRNLGAPNAFEPGWMPPLGLRFTTHPTSFPHRMVGSTPWPATRADLRSESLQLGWLLLGATQVSRSLEGTPGRVHDQLYLIGFSSPLTPPLQLLQVPEARLRVGLAGPSVDLLWHIGLDAEWSILSGALDLPRLRIALGRVALEAGFGSLRYDIQLGDFEATDPYSDKVTHWRRRVGFVGSFDALLILVL